MKKYTRRYLWILVCMFVLWVAVAGTARAAEVLRASLEHMMFRGRPGLSDARLASLIAAMGGEFNDE